MAKKRVSSTSRASQNSPDPLLRQAIASGRTAAHEVLAFRARQHRQRRATKSAVALRRDPETPPAIPAETLAKIGPRANAGVLIAEGDSWFDYPMHDVLQILEDTHLFDVESVAHKGDCVEDMAYSNGQLEEFSRRLEKLLRAGKVPKAILVSGGGNDIAGDEFAIMLNHAQSGLPDLNEDVARGVIDVRLRAAYARILSGITEVARTYLDRPIPIVVHGYDYPVPDGRGFIGGWWLLPGPWLKPGFLRKGFEDLKRNTEVVGRLIDRFNVMLEALPREPEFGHVHYLNLRGTLERTGKYRQDWGNELHPTRKGFERVTARFAELIQGL